MIGGYMGNTFPKDLDDHGRAVGAFAYSSARYAWVWDAVNGPRFLDDLIDPNFEVDNLRSAEAINNNGQIAVYGRMAATGNDEYLVLVTPVHKLTVTKNKNWGDVDVVPAADPNLADPNDPNTPAYVAGTEVTLTGVPIEGRGFHKWVIHDPRYPGDTNFAVEDSNISTTIVMDNVRVVEAHFKCSSGVDLMLPVLVVAAGLCGFAVRSRRGPGRKRARAG